MGAKRPVEKQGSNSMLQEDEDADLAEVSVTAAVVAAAVMFAV